jgi:hypothetical protein
MRAGDIFVSASRGGMRGLVLVVARRAVLRVELGADGTSA